MLKLFMHNVVQIWGTSPTDCYHAGALLTDPLQRLLDHRPELAVPGAVRRHAKYMHFPNIYIAYCAVLSLK
jgi:hypothetical protein